MQFAYKLTDT